MPVISTPTEFNTDDLYVDLRGVVGHRLFLKCEGFNFAGSVKLKAAVQMVDDAERAGRLQPGSVLVESSSGNLGVALAVIAASRGYGFVCITDSRCNLATRLLMTALGADVQVVTEPHPTGGLLQARIELVQALCTGRSDHVWLDQYTNPGNWGAHHRTTAREIATAFPDVDVVFVGAGTTGTLMGCARWFAAAARPVRVVAVDSVGSVAFGAPAARRMIPGLGAGIRPPLLDEELVHDVVWVEEADTVRTCHALARRGFVFGGSTGTVVAGATDWLSRHGEPGLTSVTISPDLGERYLETVYQPNWVEALYGADVLAPGAIA